MKLHIPVKWKFTLESKFTTAYLKQFRKDDKWWAFKIPDIIRTIKPLDWFWINEWWVYFCEVKMLESNIFEFKQLRNNQYTALKRISTLSDQYWLNNIHAVVMVYSKKFKKFKVIKFSEILEKESKWEDKIKLLF